MTEVNNLENEIWVNIVEEPHYQVSNFGRIKSLKHSEPKLLTPCKNKIGYYTVLLNKHSYSVQTLVGKYFVPNPDNLPELNHKDEDKANNRADNLQWCTHYYNMHYGNTLNKLRASRMKAVRCIETNEEYESIKAAAEAIGASNDLLSRHLAGKLKSAKKLHFEYI